MYAGVSSHDSVAVDVKSRLTSDEIEMSSLSSPPRQGQSEPWSDKGFFPIRLWSLVKISSSISRRTSSAAAASLFRLFSYQTLTSPLLELTNPHESLRGGSLVVQMIGSASWNEGACSADPSVPCCSAHQEPAYIGGTMNGARRVRALAEYVL